MVKYLSLFRIPRFTCAMAGALLVIGLPVASAWAADPVVVEPAVPSVPDVPTLQSLRGLLPPDPSGTEGGRKVDLMTDYVLNRPAAVLLGKALFWDMEIGSDGSTACASCHFHAGADHRTTNQINPGQANTNANVSSIFNKPFTASDIPGDVPTYTTKSGGKGGPNYQLKKSDFPTHVLANPLDRNSAILFSTDDVIGSQGVFDANFVKPHQARFDKCVQQPDGIFQVGGINVRRSTGRNAPTVINAAFNVRNFWDGRANNVFNGFSPFGNRDPDAGIFVTSDRSGVATKVRLALKDASAASQAVGPPGSPVEMSCGGRTFADIGRRMLDTLMLKQQRISSSDSVLGPVSGARRPTYRELIKNAFQPRLWNATQQVSLGGAPYTQMEANFPLFFGLAIQLYESTLISDQAPLDAYLQGDHTAMNGQQVQGMNLFLGKGKCISCHGGAELTNAGSRLLFHPRERIERMVMADNLTTLYDNGFYNTGVRPTSEDLALGGTDAWGNPLSFTREYNTLLQGGQIPDPLEVDVCTFEVPLSPAIPCDATLKPKVGFRDSVDGAFKTPTLRNIALTGPYFHNGSRATLQQVMEFYNRGGDRRGEDASNTSGFEHPAVNQHNGSNLDPDMTQLNLTPDEVDALVKFMEVGLTDPRVAWERAPFDHPSLVLPQGEKGDENSVGQKPASPKITTRQAQDADIQLRPVGAEGRTRLEGPLLPFNNDL
ncbi:cytochrome c peroxidase [Pseudomonas sp. P5_109]|uniref:cytochrome-c peroxidase n=1 Tax=Pseudomonas sp. P5_109 TaxID=3043441 RepID=UPI002A35A2BB|nr:cytochrome c peroxidase [Pseudomonas sp. P5_109]WPN33284.1 cytochrome c peroxidase [Pseudomonas sp. P5_109]